MTQKNSARATRSQYPHKRPQKNEAQKAKSKKKNRELKM